MKQPLLIASHLSKAFIKPQRIQILTDISLHIERGESIAITGRSGVGKTTLLHILGTLESFDSGELCIAGKQIARNGLAKLKNQHIGFIFQSFNLLEDFTALENVLMPRYIGRRPIHIQQGMDLLDAVDLRERAHFPVGLLSGGEKQRVAIARALSNDPDILLADEPSGNLDQANADAIIEKLFHLTRFHNKALLLVTHDLLLASRCDRHYILSQGTLLQNRVSDNGKKVL